MHERIASPQQYDELDIIAVSIDSRSSLQADVFDLPLEFVVACVGRVALLEQVFDVRLTQKRDHLLVVRLRHVVHALSCARSLCTAYMYDRNL